LCKRKPGKISSPLKTQKRVEGYSFERETKIKRAKDERRKGFFH
jgi:hypothetical protein